MNNQAPTTRSQAAAAAASNSPKPPSQQNVQQESRQHGNDNSKRCDRGRSNFLQKYREDSKINVGTLFQADIPAYDPAEWRIRDESNCENEDSICLWKPIPADKYLSNERMDEFLKVVRENHFDCLEEAYELLYKNDYDVNRASEKLPDTRPVLFEWTEEEKQLFEEAYEVYGKAFRRIKQYIPDKTIAQLIDYYHNWKPKQQCAADIDFLERCKQKPLPKPCDSCDVPCIQSYETPETKKFLCGTCFLHWRRFGEFRNSMGKSNITASSNCALQSDTVMAMEIDENALRRQATLRKLEEQISVQIQQAKLAQENQ